MIDKYAPIFSKAGAVVTVIVSGIKYEGKIVQSGFSNPGRSFIILDDEEGNHIHIINLCQSVVLVGDRTTFFENAGKGITKPHEPFPDSDQTLTSAPKKENGQKKKVPSKV